MLLTTLMAVSAGCALADSIPPTDPEMDVAGGGTSTAIFSPSFDFTFSTTGCPTSPSGIVQACFDGLNESGINWNNLTLTINFNSSTDGGNALTCASNVYTSHICPEILPTGSNSVTLKFFGGVGIPTTTVVDAPNPSHFIFEAIAPGCTDLSSSCMTKWNTVPSGGHAVGSVPEPGTFALLLTGIGVLVARRKLRDRCSLRA